MYWHYCYGCRVGTQVSNLDMLLLKAQKNALEHSEVCPSIPETEIDKIRALFMLEQRDVIDTDESGLICQKCQKQNASFIINTGPIKLKCLDCVKQKGSVDGNKISA